MHRTARLLAVFAVLAGLLAMHGMRGEHSAMGGQPMAATTVGNAQLTSGGISAVPEVRRPQPAMTSMATLCLAIRSSGPTPGPVRGCAVQTTARASYRSGLEASASRAGPTPRPPDLVAGLCVSRT